MSSSPLDTRAWLAPSSHDSSSESLSDRVDVDFGLLGIEDPKAGEGSDGCVDGWGEISGYCHRVRLLAGDTSGLLDTDVCPNTSADWSRRRFPLIVDLRRTLSVWWASSGSSSLCAAPSPSVVVSMLRIPKELSPTATLAEVSGVSNMLSVAMKNVVEPPWPGIAIGVVASGSVKLCFRESTGRASPPINGRIARTKQSRRLCSPEILSCTKA